MPSNFQYPEWRTKDSIYKFIKENLDSDGKLSEKGFELPDELEVGGKNQLRFAPGMMDAVMGGEEPAPEELEYPLELLNKIGFYGDKESESNLYNILISRKGFLDWMEILLDLFMDLNIPMEPHLFNFAKDLIKYTDHRNCVKFGIALLGISRKEEIVYDLLILGAHDEFTLFTSTAILNIEKNAEYSLLEMAKRVDGWGKIQTVRNLCEVVETNEVKEWLIKEGFKNSIMNEYLAFICAVTGDLNERLKEENLESDIFDSAGEIIIALIDGGPAEDMSDYESSVELLHNYINHFKEKGKNLSHFITLDSIKNFLEEIRDDLNPYESHGWNQDNIADLLIEINPLYTKVEWKINTEDGLKSSDSSEFWKARICAKILSIDYWDEIWRRLQKDPHSNSLWWDATEIIRPDKVDQLVEFAKETFDLKKMARGPSNELGFGKEFEDFFSLENLLRLLQKYPGKGEDLILTGLNSPVIRTRNTSLQTLKRWGKENWSGNIRTELYKLLDIEKESKTKKTILELLD